MTDTTRTPASEARRAEVLDWCAYTGIPADLIPDRPGSLTVTRDSLGALHVHWLEFVKDDDGKPVIDEPNLTIVTRAREKSTDATPPGWTDGTDPWDAWAWIHLPVIGETT